MDLKVARTQACMSQAHLAAAARVSRRTVVRAEGGHRVSGESLRCLRAVLDVPAGATWRPSPVPRHRGILGWLQGEGSRSTALDYAAEWADRHLAPARTLHVGALPWGDGHLWEAQADGDGTGFLEEARSALTAGRTRWYPLGGRANIVRLLDGRPSLITLPQGRDGAWAGAEAEPLRPTFPLLRLMS